MSDNLRVPTPEGSGTAQPEEPEIIHLHDAYELRDWAIYFSVSQDKLRAAVAAVGPWVKDVKAYLGK